MPIGKAEILAVLADPVLSRMNFAVGDVKINVRQYKNVADYIADGDIGVISGTGALAFYDGNRNEIETQAGNPPLGLADRAQILHECTHALADIDGVDVLRLTDEVAAYLAQLIYMHISNPGPLPTGPRGAAGPRGRLIMGVNAVIRKYELHQPKGFGVSISDLDIWNLANDVRRHPDYTTVRHTDKTSPDPRNRGVPVKTNQMRALKAALKGGPRRARIYTPSPRLEIF